MKTLKDEYSIANCFPLLSSDFAIPQHFVESSENK